MRKPTLMTLSCHQTREQLNYHSGTMERCLLQPRIAS